MMAPTAPSMPVMPVMSAVTFSGVHTVQLLFGALVTSIGARICFGIVRLWNGGSSSTAMATARQSRPIDSATFLIMARSRVGHKDVNDACRVACFETQAAA